MAETNTSLVLAHQQSEHQNQLPRAIAKEKDGVVLYWVEELGVAGLHQRGIEKLLCCSISTVQNAIKGCTGIDFLDAEIITESGLKTVQLVTETDLAKVLRYIARSKAKPETRDRADDIRDRLAAAGFKLMVMLELAPAELTARAVSHLEQEMELERLRNEGRMLEAQKAIAEQKTISLRHAVVTTMPKAIADRVLGVTEVRDIEYRRTIVDNSGFVLNAGNTKTKGALCEEFGFVTRSGKPDYKAINALVEDAIACGAIPNPWREVRTLASLEFDAELVPNLKKFYESSPIKRQLWLGES